MGQLPRNKGLTIKRGAGKEPIRGDFTPFL